jgi:hypothetical protein
MPTDLAAYPSEIRALVPIPNEGRIVRFSPRKLAAVFLALMQPPPRPASGCRSARNGRRELVQRDAIRRTRQAWCAAKADKWDVARRGCLRDELFVWILGARPFVK